jgi:hypothetical protein
MRRTFCVAVLFVSTAAHAYYDGTGPGPGLTGNDTGGIIAWTPYTDHIYRAWAAEHCAKWDRRAEITSVHRHYGDYIGFVCLYDRRYDPRKAALTWHQRWFGW